MNIRETQQRCYANAIAKGFWNGVVAGDTSVVLSKLMLITTEVAEAAEVYRVCDPRHLSLSRYEEKQADTIVIVSSPKDGYGALNKPVGFDSELADIVIRTMDLASHMGIDLQQAIEEKRLYNATRERMHGKNC